MNDSKPEASDLTKLVIKKIHGGQKQHTKYYQSAFLDRQRFSSARAENTGPSILKQILALLCGLLVGIAIILYYKNYTFPYLRSLWPLKHEASIPRSEIKSVVEEVISGKKTIEEPFTYEKKYPVRNDGDYEIKLKSGGKIIMKNPNVNEKTISFISEGGLLVSININDVKSMTKLNRIY